MMMIVTSLLLCDIDIGDDSDTNMALLLCDIDSYDDSDKNMTLLLCDIDIGDDSDRRMALALIDLHIWVKLLDLADGQSGANTTVHQVQCGILNKVTDTDTHHGDVQYWTELLPVQNDASPSTTTTKTTTTRSLGFAFQNVQRQRRSNTVPVWRKLKRRTFATHLDWSG